MRFVVAVAVVLAGMLGALAEVDAVTISTVPVGDAGNGSNPYRPKYGAVAYDYRIGTTEVTNAQYVEFLNAKAANDSHDLYSDSMGTHPSGGIVRSGSDGSYTYAPKANMGDKPVNFVSWFDSLRFANWLNNGQGNSDTETGAYTILTEDNRGSGIIRNPGATWFLPSENEWYKAAYYQPAEKGGDISSYWLYPTASNSKPVIATANASGDVLNPGANVANYHRGADWNGQDGNVTTVGSAGPLSESYYGTSDQGGNVNEWNDTLIDGFSGFYPGIRGGVLTSDEFIMKSTFVGPETDAPALGEWYYSGFRVATVPEPTSCALAAIGIAALLAVRRRNA
jgi:formylglycine-generating enzyme required for sulfatase activity